MQDDPMIYLAAWLVSATVVLAFIAGALWLIWKGLRLLFMTKIGHVTLATLAALIGGIVAASAFNSPEANIRWTTVFAPPIVILIYGLLKIKVDG